MIYEIFSKIEKYFNNQMERKFPLFGINSSSIFFTILLLTPLLIVFYHDLYRSFIMNSDADFYFSYEAIRLNSNLPQIHDDHTGFSYILILGWWYKILYFFHALPVPNLSSLIELAPKSNILEPLKLQKFMDIFAQFIYAGRWLSLMIATCYIYVFFIIARLYTNCIDAVLISLIIATSSGLITQAVMLRTEGLSALGALLAFYTLIKATRSIPKNTPIWLLATGMLVMFSIEAKLQSIIYLMMFPIIIMFFKPDYDYKKFFVSRDSTILWGLISVIFIIISASLVISAIKHPLSKYGITSGYYQLATLGWISGSIAIYGVINKIPIRWISINGSALFLGLSIGLLFHEIRHNPPIADALINFIEHMGRYSPVGGQSFEKLLIYIIKHFIRSITPIFFPSTVTELTIALGPWLCLVGIFFALYFKFYKTALQATTLLSMSLLMLVIFSLRGFPPWYHIFFQSWPLIGILIISSSIIINVKLFKYIKNSALILMLISNLYISLSPAALHIQETKNACGQSGDFIEERLRRPFQIYCKN